jgi:hypothetical protein
VHSHFRRLRWVLIALVLSVVPLWAVVSGGYSGLVDFRNVASSAQATWSPSLKRTPQGLVAANGDQFWVQLAPIAVGPSFRLPRATDLDVTLGSDAPLISNLEVFFRCGIDRVHWTSWYDMKPIWEKPTQRPHEFKGGVALPTVARERFDSRWDEWQKTKPEWPNDEHEFCVWLAATHPDYFATEVPLIGYVQIRIEGWSRETLRLTTVKVSGEYSISGLGFGEGVKSRPSKDGDWFFDLSTVRQSVK